MGGKISNNGESREFCPNLINLLQRFHVLLLAVIENRCIHSTYLNRAENQSKHFKIKRETIEFLNLRFIPHLMYNFHNFIDHDDMC